ncbi:hypothetical protein EDB85DRAFT_1885423 [Lactarius pseudohatsudake]|nr:hypothetical protein EDB85DRAFT_1885423 [Lactarius pseudohatsudake]
MCATPANWQRHESRSITQGFSSLTASTAPASRGPSQLAQGYKTVLGVSSSVFQSREGMRDKCDVALGEERHPMKYIKREHPSDCTASQCATTQHIARQDHTRDGVTLRVVRHPSDGATLHVASQQQCATTQQSRGNHAPKKEGAKKVTFSPVITKRTSPNDI